MMWLISDGLAVCVFACVIVMEDSQITPGPLVDVLMDNTKDDAQKPTPRIPIVCINLKDTKQPPILELSTAVLEKAQEILCAKYDVGASWNANSHRLHGDCNEKCCHYLQEPDKESMLILS